MRVRGNEIKGLLALPPKTRSEVSCVFYDIGFIFTTDFLLIFSHVFFFAVEIKTKANTIILHKA